MNNGIEVLGYSFYFILIIFYMYLFFQGRFNERYLFVVLYVVYQFFLYKIGFEGKIRLDKLD